MRACNNQNQPTHCASTRSSQSESGRAPRVSSRLLRHPVLASRISGTFLHPDLAISDRALCEGWFQPQQTDNAAAPEQTLYTLHYRSPREGKRYSCFDKENSRLMPWKNSMRWRNSSCWQGYSINTKLLSRHWKKKQKKSRRTARQLRRQKKNESPKRRKSPVIAGVMHVETITGGRTSPLSPPGFSCYCLL